MSNIQQRGRTRSRWSRIWTGRSGGC